MRLKNTNRKYTQIAIYVIVVALIIDILKMFLGYTPAVVATILDRLAWILKVIKPIILGFVFAYLMEPMVNFLEKQFIRIKFLKKKQKSCRTYSIIATLVIVFTALAAMVSLLVFSVTDQLRLAKFDDFIVLAKEYKDMVDDFYYNINNKLSQMNLESTEISEYVTQASSKVLGIIQNITRNFVSTVTDISGYISTFIFAIIICIYFLSDGQMIKNYLSKVFRALFSDKFNKRAASLLADADMVFSGYIRGQMTDALVMMVLISISLSLIGVKFAIVIGICAGVGNLIPYCGPIVAYLGTALVCLLNGQYRQLVLALIVLFIIQAIDGNVIGPRLLSHSINIHPLLVMVSLIFGSAIGGLMGMLLAVPVGAFIKVLFVKFIDYRIEIKKKVDAKD